MKCLIIDVVHEAIAQELGKYMEVKVSEKLPPAKDELKAMIGDVDVLIMRVDPMIDKEVLDAAKNLKVIGVCSVGLNHIDTKYAEEKGIKVFNAPGLNGNAVAELTICKMLELSRHTIPAHRDVTVNQKWDKYAFVGRELRGKTLGVLGFGRIGKVLAHDLSALGAKVSVSARKRSDLAWIDAFGYAPLHTNRLSGTLGEFRVVFNTVPHQVLDEALLAELPPDCLLIELASASGFDMDAVETLRLSYLKAGGLPGRVAPETAARAIKKTLCRLIKEEA